MQQTTITITKRTSRNTCFTIVGPREPEGRKSHMLHNAFAEWLAVCPSYVVIDNAK